MIQPKKKWGWAKSQTPKDDRKKLIATLDRWFSKFIRLRDSDSNGICRCITCGKPDHWKEVDAGHFVSREKMVVRYDERNVHAQCYQCNRFKSGNQFEHGKAIDRKYGPGTADTLVSFGKVRGGKMDSYFLELKIDEYKAKVKKLLAEKV